MWTNLCTLALVVNSLGAVAGEELDKATKAAVAAKAVAEAEQNDADTTVEKESDAVSEAVGGALQAKDPSLLDSTIEDAKEEAKSSFEKVSKDGEESVDTAAVVAANAAEAVVDVETGIPVTADSSKVVEEVALAAADGVAAHPDDGAAAVQTATKEAADGPTQPSDLSKLEVAASNVLSVAEDGFTEVAHPGLSGPEAFLCVVCVAGFIGIVAYRARRTELEANKMKAKSPMTILQAFRRGDEGNAGDVALAKTHYNNFDNLDC